MRAKESSDSTNHPSTAGAPRGLSRGDVRTAARTGLPAYRLTELRGDLVEHLDHGRGRQLALESAHQIHRNGPTQNGLGKGVHVGVALEKDEVPGVRLLAVARVGERGRFVGRDPVNHVAETGRPLRPRTPSSP